MPIPPRNRLRRFIPSLSSLMLLLTGVVFSLLLAEILVRTVKFKPRLQIIRPDAVERLTVIDGAPVWWQRGSWERIYLNCPHRAAGPATNVLFFGDSIFYGVSLRADQTFAGLLQEKLARTPATSNACVLNFSQAGFNFDSKWALAKWQIKRYRPKLVYWEIWQGEVGKYVMIGDTAYTLPASSLGEDGYPSAFPLPRWLNRWGFRYSRLYEYSTLARVPLQSELHTQDQWREYAAAKIGPLDDLARQWGSRLVLVFCPALGQGFAQSSIDPFPGYDPVLEAAKAKGIPTLDLAKELRGQDVETLRLDNCCHYNARGHQVLADLFYAHTLKLLNGSRPPARKIISPPPPQDPRKTS